MGEVKVTVDRKVSALNDELAGETRALLEARGILCVNIMGAPGSGKTTLIEGLAPVLGVETLGVIQGDLESDIDQKRLEARGIRTHQINTHSGCHLNAKLVSQALASFPLGGIRHLLIENVGNLVCPATKQIGQHVNLTVSSTTEGHDKPRKYPIIFLNSDIVIIAKGDLAAAVDFDEESYRRDLANINGRLQIFKVSLKEPDSFAAVAEALRQSSQLFFRRKV